MEIDDSRSVLNDLSKNGTRSMCPRGTAAGAENVLWGRYFVSLPVTNLQPVVTLRKNYTVFTIVPQDKFAISKRSVSSNEEFAFVYRHMNDLIPSLLNIVLFTSDKGGGKRFCPCLSVCLSVSKITQKCVHGFG